MNKYQLKFVSNNKLMYAFKHKNIHLQRVF